MVKPKVCQISSVLFDQILMRACMTIDMSHVCWGRLWMVGVRGEGCCLAFKLRHADQPRVSLLNGTLYLVDKLNKRE